jgi:hypothetical protein
MAESKNLNSQTPIVRPSTKKVVLYIIARIMAVLGSLFAVFVVWVVASLALIPICFKGPCEPAPPYAYPVIIASVLASLLALVPFVMWVFRKTKW